MKKIIILAIATLSTGIVLSRSLKKEEITVKPVAPISAQKDAGSLNKNAATPSYDVVSSAD